MDDYGIDDSYMVKIVAGVVIGLLLLFLVVPLVADVVATQSVANAANQALEEVNTSNSLPATTSSVLPTASQKQPTNSSNNMSNDVNDKKTNSPEGMQILSGTITTGSSLSSKSECTIYVGKEYAGTDIKISTLYSRDGTDLNAGRLVAKTVDSNGYVTLKAADSYELYPDECLITIFDSNGHQLDYRIVYLETVSGSQSF
jgi:hypothetical protein